MTDDLLLMIVIYATSVLFFVFCADKSLDDHSLSAWMPFKQVKMNTVDTLMSLVTLTGQCKRLTSTAWVHLEVISLNREIVLIFLK